MTFRNPYCRFRWITQISRIRFF